MLIIFYIMVHVLNNVYVVYVAAPYVQLTLLLLTNVALSLSCLITLNRIMIVKLHL